MLEELNNPIKEIYDNTKTGNKWRDEERTSDADARTK